VGTWTSALRFSIRELLLLLAIVGLALSSYLNYSPLRYTGEPLDVAIHGAGYFCLIDEQTAEDAYTRCGHFKLDDNRRLVLQAGGKTWLVQPPICLPAEVSAVAISPGGVVLAREGNTSQSNAWGQIQLAVFDHPRSLRQIAPAVFDQTAASGLPRLEIPGNNGVGLVCQGALRVTAY
jgi:flagellar basal-body rod protein FlgG